MQVRDLLLVSPMSIMAMCQAKNLLLDGHPLDRVTLIDLDRAQFRLRVRMLRDTTLSRQNILSFLPIGQSIHLKLSTGETCEYDGMAKLLACRISYRPKRIATLTAIFELTGSKGPELVANSQELPL